MSYATFHKEIRRAITGSLGRFVAIFAIVALGVGFYSGLMMTAPDMERAADAFYDGTRLMDVRVVSSMGMTDADLEALRGVAGVEEVMGARETDVMAEVGGEPYAVRVHSLPGAASSSSSEDGVAVASDDDGYLNRLVLAEGRWPESPDECVISADRIMDSPVSPGDALRVEQTASGSEDALAEADFEIVGLVHSSYYASSTSMGSTSLGTGRVQQFAFVPDGAFSPDYPITEAFVTVAGARELDGSSDEYDAAVSEVVRGIEAIAPAREQARLDGLRAEAASELAEARADFESERDETESELADAAAALDAAARKIASGEDALASGQADYDEGVRSLEAGKAEAASRLAAAQEQIDANAAALTASLAEWEEKAAAFEVVKDALPPDEAEQTALALAAGKSQIDAGMSALADARRELASERDAADAQASAAERRLASARSQLRSARAELEQGRADYDRGKSDYQSARAEADAAFADAEAELARAQADIDAIERPEWLVMDRSKNYGAESFAQDATRIQSIAQVFPLIFFLVAALVALTTMTRMIDEERMLIGTYKALGYSRARISSKYLVYALSASLGGSVVGIAALAFTLPYVIMTAYSIVYIVPVGSLAVDWPIAVGATALGVGITLVATWGAVASTLRESPAALMLPKAPKSGKRILLERVRPLWSRLSFLWKVTCRNLFRYKKRMVMTVVGIAGCTALMLTGFGLHNSINDIIDIHFNEIVRYNTTVVLEDDAPASDALELERVLSEEGELGARASSNQRNVVAVSGSDERVVPLVVPTDADAYEEVRVFRDRVTHEQIELSDAGALLTEKLGTLLGVGPGDEIELATPDSTGNASGERVRVRVARLVENYVENAIFVTGVYHEQVFGEGPETGELGYNTLVFMSSLDDAGRSVLAEDVRGVPGVKTLAYNDETIESYRASLKSVNMIVYVLIAAAALLAFIVLYNLTNINITERVREIATLKVLGFTQREVQRYIFREIVILSALGAAAGLAVGVYLENFVVVTAEIDAAMFGREIHAASFALAFALTMLFTWIVTVFMRRKLDRVDMVESLKSNE